MRISDWSSDVCSSDLAGAASAASFALAPPPAKAGGGWEGVLMARTDPKGTPPQPVRPDSTAGVRSLAREQMVRKRAASPTAFAGEGAKARGFRRSYNSEPYAAASGRRAVSNRSEEQTSELQSIMRTE